MHACKYMPLENYIAKAHNNKYLHMTWKSSFFFYRQIPAVGRTKKTTYSNREGEEREGRKEKSKIDGPAARERRELGGRKREGGSVGQV